MRFWRGVLYAVCSMQELIVSQLVIAVFVAVVFVALRFVS